MTDLTAEPVELGKWLIAHHEGNRVRSALLQNLLLKACDLNQNEAISAETFDTKFPVLSVIHKVSGVRRRLAGGSAIFDVRDMTLQLAMQFGNR
ncbi:MAG: hypothetical protein WCV82_02495 [Candidatus Paceibacterota bacterium]